MMKKISIAIAALSLVAALGCNQKQNESAQQTSYSQQPAATASQNLSPEELGELGAKIKKHPKDAQKLLSEKGLTEQSFEQQVRKVAESPDDSKRYAEAYKKAS